MVDGMREMGGRMGERTNRDSEGQVQNGFKNCPTTDATFPCAGGQIFGPPGGRSVSGENGTDGALFKAGGRRGGQGSTGAESVPKGGGPAPPVPSRPRYAGRGPAAPLRYAPNRRGAFSAPQ